MPGQKKIRVSRGSGLKKDEMLRSKYFCQVTRNQMLDMVMEISAPPRPDIKRPPLRYVLVIDVSSSMKYKVGKSTESLLDRVKVFAELVIRKVANKDSLGIVSFAKNVKIEFPVTIMSNDAKVRALGVVRELTVRGGTNLELGMMTGLEVLKDSQSAENKDLIVIFTDGEANKGSTDATEMIANYNEAQAKSGNSACVPISAFTIGGYVPALLDELSQHLGSDAFYWLNENEEFESDMLMPILLREETHVTDVKIKMTCLEGVTFNVDATYKTAAMDLTKDELNYFIHSFPQATMKQIPLKFNLPPESSALDQRPVLDIEITYIDDKMMNRIMKESVLLSSAVLSNVLGASQINQPRGPFGILDSVSAYSVKNNAIDTSLKAANAALVSVAEAKCRVESMVAMEKIAKSITNGEEPSEREEVVRKALSEIAHVRDEYSSIYKRMGNRKSTGQLANSANEWKDKIEFGATLNNKKALGRLFAMSSSIKNQMPAAKGVFSASQKRPFLPNKVEKKLHQYEKILAVTKEKKRREKAREKEPKKQSITKVFKTQNVLLSESLRDKKVGAKRDTLSELVVKCGGRPVPNVNTVRTDTFLLCSDKDFKRDSMLVRDAKRAKRQTFEIEERAVEKTTSEPRKCSATKKRLSAGKRRESMPDIGIGGMLHVKVPSTVIFEDLLRTKYYCQVTKQKDVDLVMELTAVPCTSGKHSCLRYVMIVDVSGSMDAIVGKSSDSILERIKVFVDVVIHKIAHDDSLAIVSFADNARVDFPLTAMTDTAKEEALKVVQGLQAGGDTNLELGLVAGLNLLQGGEKEDRDLIILFTDGEPNKGQMDATELVKQYRQTQASLGKESCVPLSAFTLGGYTPTLLHSLSCQLGSDAFYWLNEHQEFERDMLTTIFLREKTTVSDVVIEMSCCDAVNFNIKLTYKTDRMELSLDSMNTKIHSIVEGTKKHIPLRLRLSKDMQDLIDKPIVNVKLSYLDNIMRKRELTDTVTLALPPPTEVDGPTKRQGSFLPDITAFCVTNNVADTTKTAAQTSLAAVADSKCRVVSMAAISRIVNSIKGSQHIIPTKIARETILEINRINNHYKSVIRESSKQSQQLREDIGNWIARVNFSGTFKNKRRLGRLFAMQSSLENEMPAARGVFDPQQRQPYLHPELEEQLHHINTIIKKTTRRRREEMYAKTHKPFQLRNVLLSESLRYKKVGRRQETFWELVIRCGGRPGKIK